MVSALWKKLSRWSLRAAGQVDFASAGRCKSVEDVREEKSVGEVAARTEASSNAVALSLPAITALDELFENAGIDRDLGNSSS